MEPASAAMRLTAPNRRWLFGPGIRPGTSDIDGKVVRIAGSAWRPAALSAATDPRFEGTISIAPNNDDCSAVGGPTI